MIFAKENEDTKEKNNALQARKAQRHGTEKESRYVMDSDEKPTAAGSDFADRRVFTWENLNYHVPVPGGTRRLLHDVMGYVKPGTLTALMGASGAGKTTCLDVLAQRKNIGIVTGEILVGTLIGWVFYGLRY